MGEQTIESKRVISTVCDRLSSLFEDYLAENIGGDILSCYYEGFTIAQVADDLNEAIKEWANDENNLQSLTEMVETYADDYLDEPEEY